MAVSGIPNFSTEFLKTPEGLGELNRILTLFNDNVAGDTDTVRVYDGYGTPENVITAGVGSLYMRLDGSTGTTIYIKESGTLATGWVAVAQLSTPVSLSNGGTGQSLSDPGADRVLFWDDSAGKIDWLSAGDGINVSGTTVTSDYFLKSVTSFSATNNSGIIPIVASKLYKVIISITDIVSDDTIGLRFNSASSGYVNTPAGSMTEITLGQMDTGSLNNKFMSANLLIDTNLINTNVARVLGESIAYNNASTLTRNVVGGDYIVAAALDDFEIFTEIVTPNNNFVGKVYLWEYALL